MGYRFTVFLHTAVIQFGGYRFRGGPYRFTRVLLMSLNFVSACSWLLHDNESGRSYIRKHVYTFYMHILIDIDVVHIYICIERNMRMYIRTYTYICILVHGSFRETCIPSFSQARVAKAMRGSGHLPCSWCVEGFRAGGICGCIRV